MVRRDSLFGNSNMKPGGCVVPVFFHIGFIEQNSVDIDTLIMNPYPVAGEAYDPLYEYGFRSSRRMKCDHHASFQLFTGENQHIRGAGEAAVTDHVHQDMIPHKEAVFH